MDLHGYNASGFISVGYNAGTGYDLVLLAAAATVPVYLDRVQLTGVVSGNPILPIQVQRRSTASTGGSAVTPSKDSPASPASSTTVTTLNVTTTGTVADVALDSQDWQQFGPYIYDVRPKGKLITPATWLGIYMPTPFNGTIAMGYRVEWREAK